MKFSIITVVYNSVSTIEKAINSVLSQTYHNIEYIVIDGGSEDGTLEIIKKYENRISKLLSEPDDGVYDAMNKGIYMATGDVIAFLNSDDWYEPDALEYIEEQFKDNDLAIFFANIMVVNGKRIEPAKPVKADGIKQMHKYMTAHHPAIFAKRKLFLQHGVFDKQYRIAADYDWVLRIIKTSPVIGYSDKVTTYFVMGGISNTNLKDTYEEVKRIAFKHAVQGREREEVLSFYKEQDIIWHYRDILNKEFEVPIIKGLFQFPTEHKLYVFGMGQIGEECYKLLQKASLSITGFLVNNNVLWGETYKGLPIFPPKVLHNEEDFVIIASTRYEEEIQKQLESLGFKQNDGFMLYSDIRKLVIEKLGESKK